MNLIFSESYGNTNKADEYKGKKNTNIGVGSYFISGHSSKDLGNTYKISDQTLGTGKGYQYFKEDNKNKQAKLIKTVRRKSNNKASNYNVKRDKSGGNDRSESKASYFTRTASKSYSFMQWLNRVSDAKLSNKKATTTSRVKPKSGERNRAQSTFDHKPLMKLDHLRTITDGQNEAYLLLPLRLLREGKLTLKLGSKVVTKKRPH